MSVESSDPDQANYLSFRSEVLQKLVSLGVDLTKFEGRDRKSANFVLKCDWEKDIHPRLAFLHQVAPQGGEGGWGRGGVRARGGGKEEGREVRSGREGGRRIKSGEGVKGRG